MPRTMIPLMSPQSIEPPSDELFATTQSPNTTPKWTTSKRAIASDDNESADEVAEAALELSAMAEHVERLNKRFKHTHVVLNYDVQSTRAIDPILADYDTIIQSASKASSGVGGVGDSIQPSARAIQARQEQREHQAPRPSLKSTLSSSLSSAESQTPPTFSVKERTSDSQSVYSQATAQSTYTTYPLGGKTCPTCVKHLTTGYFSEWKNHYWTIHCPQEGYYCLNCKLILVKNEGQGTLFWQCKKCLENFQDESKAVGHFTDRNLPCHDRAALWARTKPWRDHLQAECFVKMPNGWTMCTLCQETFSNTSQSKKHKCPKAAGWKYQLSNPVSTICEDHPNIVLETVDQVNDHFENEHFKQLPARSRQRHKTNAGSALGDDDSRLDNYSLDGLGPTSHDQQAHGHFISSHAESEALCQQDLRAERQHCNDVKDPAVDLREIGQKSNLQNLYYPQGDITMGDETGPLLDKLERPRTLASPGVIPSGQEPPPVLSEFVTEGGKAKFLTR